MVSLFCREGNRLRSWDFSQGRPSSEAALFLLYTRTDRHFLQKGQIVNTFRFLGHKVSVLATQF